MDELVVITGTLNVGAVMEGLQGYFRQKRDADALLFHIFLPCSKIFLIHSMRAEGLMIRHT